MGKEIKAAYGNGDAENKNTSLKIINSILFEL